MKTYCENPLCDTEAVTVVEVSVKKPSDEKRSLCACCEEVYFWGVQHGKMLSCRQKQWILAIADRGIITYAEAHPSKKMAEQALIDYLREEENYDGPDDIGEAGNWLAEHDERLGAEIFAAEPGQDNDDNVDNPDPPYETERLERFLDEGGFIVLSKNQHDPHPGLEFEAWAYQGALDFQSAGPVTFGLGISTSDALAALNQQLAQTKTYERIQKTKPNMLAVLQQAAEVMARWSHKFTEDDHDIYDRVLAVIVDAKALSISRGLVIDPAPIDKGPQPLWRAVYVIDVSAASAHTAALQVHQIMRDPASIPPVLEILDSAGKVTRFDLQSQENAEGKEVDPHE